MSFYKRTVTLPTMYAHQKPDWRTLNFAQGRIDDIEAEIEQLNLEKEMWKSIMKLVEANGQCGKCGGSGEVSYVDDPMDGRRFKRCDACNGAGKKKL